MSYTTESQFEGKFTNWGWRRVRRYLRGCGYDSWEEWNKDEENPAVEMTKMCAGVASDVVTVYFTKNGRAKKATKEIHYH